MNRRKFIITASALSLLSLTARAETALPDVSRYLNGISTAGGQFSQLNADGSLVTGQYWIDRPGLMRFQYDAPHSGLIIADGTWLGVIDPVPGTRTQRYPLAMTPLQLLLQRNVRLDQEASVQSLERRDGFLILRAQDTERPEIGTIALIFREDPMQLVQWATLDATGQQTIVQLETMTLGEEYPRALFSIEQAEFLRDR